MNREEIEKRAILVALVGSRGYGLHKSTSDYDYKGAFIAHKNYYLGTDKIEQKDNGWEEAGYLSFLDGAKDASLYEVRKLVDLLVKANPSILELLWVDSYPFINDIGAHLVKHRHLFLSQKVKHSYSGYAYAQIRKIETHRKWLLNPPVAKPNPADWGIEETVIPHDQLQAFLEYLHLLVRGRIEYLEEADELYTLLTADIDYKGLLKQHPLPEESLPYTQQLTRCSGDFMRLLHMSQEYRVKLNEWNAYQQWKTNRNPDRAGMEAKVGYDVKHFMHCLRLLKSGVEILAQGEVIVNRERAGDAHVLREILNGEWSYEKVKDFTDFYMEVLEQAYKVTTLPHHPNTKRCNELCIELVEMMGWD